MLALRAVSGVVRPRGLSREPALAASLQEYPQPVLSITAPAHRLMPRARRVARVSPTHPRPCAATLVGAHAPRPATPQLSESLSSNGQRKAYSLQPTASLVVPDSLQLPL